MYQFTVTEPREDLICLEMGDGHRLFANYRLGLVEIVDDNGDYLTLLDRSDDPHDRIRDSQVTQAFLEAKSR